MRRLLVTVVVLGALSVPAAAQAAGPSFENLSPADGAAVTIPRYSGVKVEFSCPTYDELSPFGIERTRNWLDYEVLLSPRPFIGEFGGLVVYAPVIPSGFETCSMTIPNYKVEPENTYYWRVRRANHEVVGGYEYGAATSFTTFEEAASPTVPIAPGPSGPPSTPAGAGGARKVRVSVWTGCGLSARTPRSSRCGISGKMGAFIKASKKISYTVCVRFPGGERLCTRRPQYAEARTTYVNKITGHAPGRYVVTWIVEGRRYKRVLHRVRG